MGDFAWSFLKRIREHEVDRRLVADFCFSRELIDQLDLSAPDDHVPEGLLIECCAQAGGLAMMLEKEEISHLPILAKVNLCDFHQPIPLGQEAVVEANLELLTENNAAEFRAAIHLPGEMAPRVECRVLLGLAALNELPDGGAGILTHFDGLKLSFIDA
jgi:hypothetical protein